jgi:hypothetical protein
MVQTTNVAGTDLDRGFSHLSQVLRAGTRRTAGPPTQPTPMLSTFHLRRPTDPSELHDVLCALARVEAARSGQCGSY